MKTHFRLCTNLLSLAFFVSLASTAQAQLTTPIISSIRLDESNLVVQVQVPLGIRRVTLEGRERFGTGNWQPRAVAYPEGASSVTLRLAQAGNAEVIRVRGDAETILPESFYHGVDTFLGAPGEAIYPYYYRYSLDGIAVPNAPPPPSGPAPEPARAVVESDIYAIRDTTLFFFNQYRGLQMLDVTNPDQPILRGTVSLPAAGEQMYLLGSQHVVLLTRDPCATAQAESQVLIIDTVGGRPRVTASLPVVGLIQESRLVGTALYIAAQTYRASTNGQVWEIGTVVSAFDLSNPDAPRARNAIWFPGSGNVVAATDVLFFVATVSPSDWRRSIIHTIDITSTDGTIRAYETILPAGLIKDKFKLNYAAGVLSAISEAQNLSTGRLLTRLETFRLPDPRSASPIAPRKLGEVELGHGEQLHATRFDGDRVYIVTFLRIDPLFVVSLADPEHPIVAGEVEVPGWSTFIAPLGDRLVTVGVEGSRVAVSLFDVANPARPALLSRVRLGDRYSSSEANWDEKAFTVLPADKLILVPFSDFGSSSSDAKVQLIDLERSVLTARGVIEQNLQPRRATLYRDRILSLSGRQYLSVDASDRDHLVVRGELELARPIDRIFVRENYLVELELPNNSNPVLRVAAQGNPDTVLGLLQLTNVPVWGATVRGDDLYLLQGWNSTWDQVVPLADASSADRAQSRFMLSVVSLRDLPQLQIVGQTFDSANMEVWGGASFQPVWPQENVLVWVQASSFTSFYPPIAWRSLALVDFYYPWFWGNQQGTLLAFGVANPSAPVFNSSVTIDGLNSSAYTAAGLVYVSHQSSYFWREPPYPVPGLPGGVLVDETLPATADGMRIAPDPIGSWEQRFYLDVADYADPAHPVLRQPVNIPAPLTGLSHGGELVYTLGRQWTTNWVNDGSDYLSALAYDGMAAHLVDSLRLAADGFHPVLVDGTNVFVGRDAVAPSAPVAPTDPALEVWNLTRNGRFERVSRLALSERLQMLRAFPGMLAGEGEGVISLFDKDDPTALQVLGRTGIARCLNPDLSLADGDVEKGLWIPLGIYGTARVAPSQ